MLRSGIKKGECINGLLSGRDGEEDRASVYGGRPDDGARDDAARVEQQPSCGLLVISAWQPAAVIPWL